MSRIFCTFASEKQIIMMAEYRLEISGVHYGANGDSVFGQKDTEEMHQRTRELLSWLDSARPPVVLVAEPCNHFHQNAVMARTCGRRIGRVAYSDCDLACALLRQCGRPMLLARIQEVDIKEHGHVWVTVSSADVQQVQPQAETEIEWRDWLSDLPLLPPSEQLMAEEEATFMLDTVLMPRLAEADINFLKTYLDVWLKGSRHDLSREARQQRSHYIELLEAAPDKHVRLLAEPLKEQRARICERAFLDEHATVWWTERLESPEVQRLWQQWRLRNDNKLWQGLQRIDLLLRQLPGELYSDIRQLDVVLSRMYYMNTPLKAFQAILALMMLRQLTCRELGIEMRPMTEDEYLTDGLITDPMDMPTTIGRVVAFGETQCDKAQKQTIERLVHWLRDDYEQGHPLGIESSSEKNPLVVIQPDKTEAVISKIKSLMECKSKPKDVLMPVRAAMDAGVIRRPTWEEFCKEFGARRVRSKTSFSSYTNPDNTPYTGADFDVMKEEFRKLLSGE